MTQVRLNTAPLNASGSRPAPRSAIELAGEALDIEAEAILTVKRRLDASFAAAVDLMMRCRGRVVVSGMGKSGLIARKVAATLASTGTPALFMHSGEASHGDLGMVTRDDVFLALSNSGETEELLRILPAIKRQGVQLIAMTGNPASSLAQAADIHLNAAVDKEACPLNLAPTASTTAALALGDALAVVRLDLRGFSSNDYARSHPGGSLGRRLLTHVRDVMRTGAAVPRVDESAPITQALAEISQKLMGMTAVCAADGTLVGVFTDGDLRRLIEQGRDLKELSMRDVMHRSPHTIDGDDLAAEAADLMEQFRINQLLVVDPNGILTGALHIHDLTTAKVI
jgi:arabinose-5-phosphate isomerase